MFQHTAARRRLQNGSICVCVMQKFQHTAARRRLRIEMIPTMLRQAFQHTAARRRLQPKSSNAFSDDGFNTQPRGGGCCVLPCLHGQPTSFNTQPRGGGCYLQALEQLVASEFQHTAARRRLRFNGWV